MALPSPLEVLGFFSDLQILTFMSNKSWPLYAFGEFELDVGENQLRRDGEILPLTPKAYEVLLLLVENCGHLISKEEFFQRVWEGSFVEENNLADNISTLRRVLGDDRRKPIFIETVPRRGYRFVGEVKTLVDESQDFAEPKTVLHVRHPTKRLIVIGSLICLAVLTAGLLLYFLRPETATPGSVGSDSQLQSIAVLPFKPLIVNGEDDYLEFGLADSLITKLGNIKGISVRPTTAILQYHDRTLEPREIGREQRVDAVLAGQFQKLNDQIRLTVQLVRVSDGSVVWAQTFNDHLTNIFSVQDSISTEVARAVRVQLSAEERERMAKRETANIKAYEYYLRGRYNFSKWTVEGINQAIENYQLAIAADPGYAAPVAGLSKCYHVLGTQFGSSQEMFPKARELARKAVEMDSTLGEAWSSLGLAKSNEWDWSGAERDLLRSVEVNPNYAEGHEIYATVLMLRGRMDDAINELKEARAIDPLSPSILGGLGNFLYNARRYDEAIEQYLSVLELYPDRPEVHTDLALAYARRSQPANALSEISKAINLLEGQGVDHKAPPSASLDLAFVYALTGRAADARKIIAGIKPSESRSFPALGVARVYAALGEVDKAFEWLEKAYLEHTGSLAMIKVSPDYEALRSDRRYTDLLQRIGL